MSGCFVIHTLTPLRLFLQDVRFTLDGRHLVSREYMTLKIWDVNMEARPVKTINIHEPLRPKLCDLYENDCIFDKFEAAVSGDGNNILTGSYSNSFQVHDRFGNTSAHIEASRNALQGRHDDHIMTDPNALDYDRKVLHLTWHPRQNCVAIAALNNLYIYNGVN